MELRAIEGDERRDGGHPPAADEVAAFEGRALGSALRLFVRVPGRPAGGPLDGADGPPDSPRAGIPGARGRHLVAWDAVQDEFAAVDTALSRWRDDSELAVLNRAAGSGAVLEVSWRLRTALAAMDRARRITGGRFSPGLAGALDRLGEREAWHAQVTVAPSGPGVRQLPAPASTRPVTAPPVPLDAGGIGKGLALRWAARRGLDALPAGAGLLLEAGGDVVAAGTPPAGGWRVGIEDPVIGARGEPVAVVAVADGALATSSVAVRRWSTPDGERVHHLLDPRTGLPARTGLLAVSVALPDPAWAEVWTKALFLAGRDRIAGEARARDLAAWWVTGDGGVGMSPAARQRTTWAQETRLG